MAFGDGGEGRVASLQGLGAHATGQALRLLKVGSSGV